MNKTPNLLGLTPKLLITAFIEGFVVVGIEIISTNALSLYFGNSHFVWVSTLGFTMLALALSYLFSAKFKMKNINSLIYNLLLFSALSFSIFFSFSNQLFIKINFESILVSLFFASFLIIFVPVFLLGSLSSFLIIRLNEEYNFLISASIGRIFGYSGLGSVLGATILTFFFIPNFGLSVSAILLITLLLLAASLFFEKAKKTGFIVLTVLVLIFSGKLLNYTAKTKSDTFIIKYESNGILGQIRVLDNYPKGLNYSTRRLLINGIPQTFIINNNDAYSFWNYTHFINGFASIKDSSSKTLLVGLGGGSIARELMKQHRNFEIVELDERIVDLTDKYFYLKIDKTKVHNLDVRRFILETDTKYDLIIYDVLSGEVQPNHVFSYEALVELNKKLNREAVVIINFQGILNDKEDKAFQIMMNTFKKAGFYSYYWATNPNEFDDIVFCISPDPIDFTKINKGRLNECCEASPVMPSFLTNNFDNRNFNYDLNEYLSDDKPKLDLLNTNAIRKWRKVMQSDIINPQVKEGISLFK